MTEATAPYQPSTAAEPPSNTRATGLLSAAWVPLWLALIVLLAAFLRFSGLNWDRSIHHHPDERGLTMVVANVSWPSSPFNYLDSLPYTPEGKKRLPL